MECASRASRWPQILVIAVLFGAIAVVVLSYISTRGYIGHGKVHRAASDGDVEAMCAALSRYPDSLNELRSINLDAELTTITPLMWAVCNGRSRAVDVLLQYKADVNLKDRFGRSAMWFAANNGDIPTASRLLAAGGDVNIITNFGSSPLLVAARRNDADMVKCLINAGADINLLCGRNETMPEIVRHGNVEIIKTVMDNWPGSFDAYRLNELYKACNNLPDDKKDVIKSILARK